MTDEGSSRSILLILGKHQKSIKPKRRLGTSTRVVGLLLLTGLITACTAAATLPYWMGIAMRMVIPESLISFESYQRQGYQRFELSNLSGSSGKLHFDLSGVEAYSPLVWWWKVFHGSSETPFLKAESVHLVFKPSEDNVENQSSSGNAGVVQIFEIIEKVEAVLSRWLPSLEIGSIQIEAGKMQIRLGTVSLSEGVFESQIHQLGKQSFGGDDFHVLLQLPGDDASMALELMNKQKQLLHAVLSPMLDAPDGGILANFSVDWAGNYWRGDAHWSGNGWLPKQGNLDAQRIELRLQKWLPGFPIPSIVGNLESHYVNETYSAQGVLDFSDGLEGIGAPFYLRNGKMEFEATGDLDVVSIQKADFRGDLGSLTTDGPVVFNLLDRTLQGEILAELSVDLNALNIKDLDGLVRGKLVLAPNRAANRPELRFDLNGDAIGYRGLLSEEMQLSGMADLEHVLVENFLLSVKGPEDGTSGSKLEGSGSYVYAEKKTQGLQLDGAINLADVAALLGRTLPSGVVSADIQSEVLLSPFAVNYQGVISVESLKMPGLQTLQVASSIEGSGDQLSLRELVVENPFQSKLYADVSLRWLDEFEADIQRLVLEQTTVDAEENWSLQHPLKVEFIHRQPDRIQSLPSWNVGALQLSGNNGSIYLDADLSNPAAPRLELNAKEVDLATLVQPWTERLLPDVLLKTAEVQLGVSNNTLDVKGVLDVALNFEDQWVRGNGTLDWSESGLTLTACNVTAGEHTWVSLEGNLPYHLGYANGAAKLELLQDDALSLKVSSTNSEEWIELLQPYLPIPIGRIELNADFVGRVSNPAAQVQVTIDTLPSSDDSGLPAANIRSDVRLSGTRMELDPIRVQVGEEIFEFQGKLELPEELLDLAKLEAKTTVPWDQIHYELAATRTDLAPIAHFVPHILRPAGRLDFQLKGSPASGMNGMLHVEGLSTRAIFPFGALREMEWEMLLTGTRAELNKFKGNIDREPIDATAWVDFSDFHDPDFGFNLRGKDIPLVRKAGVLLRSDLELNGEKKRGSEASIAGTLNLKNGIFLMDVASLFSGSGGGRSVSSRPPYFSVEALPFKNWNLDLLIAGDRFMTLKTPVVDGKLSVDMKLEGTLGEPYMHGSAWFDEGNIRFPFASFKIQNGTVSLNRSDPYTPVLDILADSTRLDYQLQLNVTGPADDPEVHFSSSPTLNSDQILLMIVAGEDPSGSLEYSSAQKASKIGTYLSKGLLDVADSDRSSLLSRLSLEWGNSLSKKGKETLDLEFLLDDEFQVLGEYDEYDNWNGGIRWRILNPRQRSQQSTSGLREQSHQNREEVGDEG